MNVRLRTGSAVAHQFKKKDGGRNKQQERVARVACLLYGVGGGDRRIVVLNLRWIEVAEKNHGRLTPLERIAQKPTCPKHIYKQNLGPFLQPHDPSPRTEGLHNPYPVAALYNRKF